MSFEKPNINLTEEESRAAREDLLKMERVSKERRESREAGAKNDRATRDTHKSREESSVVRRAVERAREFIVGIIETGYTPNQRKKVEAAISSYVEEGFKAGLESERKRFKEEIDKQRKEMREISNALRSEAAWIRTATLADNGLSDIEVDQRLRSSLDNVIKLSHQIDRSGISGDVYLRYRAGITPQQITDELSKMVKARDYPGVTQLAEYIENMGKNAERNLDKALGPLRKILDSQ